jgi:hypothetical protein
MLGLYYLPIPFVTHETGLTAREVKEAFKFLEAEGFAHYDADTEFVFVSSMAPWQLGDLKPHDNRVRAVNREYANLPNNPFLGAFFDLHHEVLYLEYKRTYHPAAADAAPQALRKPSPRAPEGLQEGLGKDLGPAPAAAFGDGLVNGPEEEVAPRDEQPRFADDPRHLVDLWNAQAPAWCRRVRTASDRLCAAIDRAYRHLPERRDWEEVLAEIEQSPFLHGKPWVTLDWLLKTGKDESVENYVKIRNGNFHDDTPPGLDATARRNLEVIKRFAAQGTEAARTEVNGHGAGRTDGIRGTPGAADDGLGAGAAGGAAGDLLPGPAGVPAGPGAGGDDLGPAQP